MPEVITVGEKGQMIIPKRMREDFKIHKKDYGELVSRINEMIKI